MKSHLIALGLVLLPVSGFADLNVTCLNPGVRPAVTLTEHRWAGFDLRDEGNSLVGNREDLQAADESGYELEFSLDIGTSDRRVYRFSNFQECYGAGFARDVKLEIFSHAASGEQKVLDTMACDCHSD